MRIENQTFANQEIRLDYHEFIACHFDNCTMIYGGYGPTSLEQCTFVNMNWRFVDASANTLKFLTGLYQGGGEGGRQVVEQMINNIKIGGAIH